MSKEGMFLQRKFPFLLIAFSVLVLLVFSSLFVSCGSGKEGSEPEQGPETENKQASEGQADNAKELGTLRVFVNRLEGELNEPVDAQIRGEVTRMAEDERELWVLVKVSEFNVMGPKQGSLKAAPGSELCIRLRVKEGEQKPPVGDRIEVNAMVSKSLEGPVIIGRMFKVLGGS